MAVYLSLFAGAGQQFFTNAGVPLAGGKIYTYGAGGSTPQATYTTSAGNIAHSNPIVLDAAGRVPGGGEIWLTDTLVYKFQLETSTGTIVQTLDNVSASIGSAALVAGSGSSLIGFIQSGSGAVVRTVQSKLRDVVSVKDFGAIGDGVANDTNAIQAALNAANTVVFVEGTYLVNDQLNLSTNQTLIGDGNSKIVLQAGVTPYVLRGNALDNFVMRDMTIEGNGASGNSTVYITNSTNVTIDNCKITKSGSTALWLVSCTFAKVQNCTLSNNYYYGLEFRDCDGCKAIANQFVNNGDTGVATSTGGRGIMLWRSRGCYIAGNRFVNNTEYGFRIYSEAADTTTSYNNVVTGNVFVDNVRADLVLYDEGAAFSFVTNNVISDNVIRRTIDTTDLNSVCILHGDFNTYVNNHIQKAGTFGTDCGFNFFNANYCTISNCSVENMSQAFSTSSSTNITIANCFGNGVANGVTNPTEGIIVTSCKFLHGGSGVNDVCIDNATTATGKNFYDSNYISGFYRGIVIADESVAVFRNTTVGSTNAGLFKSGNVTANYEAAENSWESANPFLLSAYSRTGSTHDQAVVKYPAAPTTLTWIRGDMVWNEEPAIGLPKGWMCTVAGTPGTWVSMGNL